MERDDYPFCGRDSLGIRQASSLSFDRLVDGTATATAPAALAADATTALEAAFHRGLAQMFTPPPRFSLCSSPLAPSGSYRKTRPQPITVCLRASSRACKPSASSRDAFRGPSHVPHSPGSLHPCNALRRCATRRHRLTPADRTVCVPDPQTDTRSSYL